MSASPGFPVSEAVKHRIGHQASLIFEPERRGYHQQPTPIESGRGGDLTQPEVNCDDIPDRGRLDVSDETSHRGKALDWIPCGEDSLRETPMSPRQSVGKDGEFVAIF